MALELGGPDVQHNIVPQWSNFQRNGKWKLMENAARAAAEKLKSGVLVYHAIVVYKPYQKIWARRASRGSACLAPSRSSPGWRISWASNRS